MLSNKFSFAYAVLALALHAQSIAQEKETKQVMISTGVLSVGVLHKSNPIELMRNQNRENTILDFYQATHRGKIQPMQPFSPHAVETIGELEMIDYLKKTSNGDDSILVIDSRTPAWVKRSGLIPGAVNIPFTRFSDSDQTIDIMEDNFDVSIGDVYDFSQARTLVMYCNGVWCGQSPTAIRKLLNMGYPAAKIKYFRGGMQSWQSLGLTVVEP